MSSIKPLVSLLKADLSKLSKAELTLLEAMLFNHVCLELKEIFRKKYKEYFRLMKFNLEKENDMLTNHFVRLILSDILDTEEYNFIGIAHYTDTPIDIIQEVLDGRNTQPSATLLCRSLELHCTVRREIYSTIIKKIPPPLLS